MNLRHSTLVLFAGFALAACATTGNNNTGDTNTEPGNIIEVASDAGSFETLLTAIDAAGLTETLSGDGPFTVFAPTDAAFAMIPSEDLNALLSDPSGALTDILLYHVVSGSMPASDVVAESLLTTLLGSDAKITVQDGTVMIGAATITSTDIQASNGVIHVIDAVLTPPATIAGIVAADPNFSTLLAAVQAANLAATLDGQGPFTVFAPTNAAFAALPAATLTSLLADPSGALTQILLYHVVSGRVTAEDVVGSTSVTTVQGTTADITVNNGTVRIDGATITMTDIPAANGLIHVINAVITP